MIDDFKKPVQKTPASSPPPNTIQTQDSLPTNLPPKNLVDDTEIETIDLSLQPSTESKYRIKTSNGNSKKRKRLIIGGIIAVLLIAGLAYYKFVYSNQDQATTAAVVEEKKKAEKAKLTSPLTGVEVKEESLIKRPVTAIMVENSPDARPQSGLDKSGVVFEAIAEGGITRFVALYQESQPEYIGPVRSARPYYVQWAFTFDASFGHVGGSPESLQLIKTLGVRDLDQFSNGGSYNRISSRPAPHNVYTSFAKLDALNTAKGYTTSKFTPWARKIDVPQTPTANIIDVSISGPTYSPRFTYDATANCYKRSQNGSPHNILASDLKTQTQLCPDVFIAMVLQKGLSSDGYHSDYKTTGSGKILVFQDGIVSAGTWSKKDDKSQYVFTDKNGLPMKLNTGQTWVTIVDSEGAVSYKP